MDINNSLVPAEFAENYQKVSKWSQPGGTLAKVITAAAAGAGIYALYLALPVVLSMMTNAFAIACLAIGLWALVSLVTNKRFRKLISTGFFLICRKITSWFITIDPISILDRHAEELSKKSGQISDSMGKFRGAIRTAETDKANAERDLNKELGLLKAYKEKGLMADSQVHANQVTRLQELIQLYDADLKRMNAYYKMLDDLRHYTKLKIDDEKNQSDMLKKRFKRTREMYTAFSSMTSVLNGQTDDIEEYEMTVQYLNQTINSQLGQIDDCLLNADSIITEINVTNSANISRANDMLDVYEKYGIEGLFMSDEQRKALPNSASGTVPVSQIGITDTDRELEYAEQKRQQILGENANTRKYV